MELSLATLVREVAERTPVGVTGNLRQSIHRDIRFEGTYMRGVVYPQVPYGHFVEEGTRGNRKAPPPGVLQLWVKRKLKGQIQVREGQSLEQAIKSAAFAIGRKIAREGTKGVFMFRKSWAEKSSRIKRIFDRYIALALKDTR